MASVVFFVLAIFLLTSCVRGMALSEEDDLELEKQLKLLNKPAVKTIKTDYGELYDCVDFYKQPAFDHPLLKNHSFHFQMKPSYRYEEVSGEERETKWRRDERISTVKLKGVGCPSGTVPIKRTTKEDLIRQKLFTEMYNSNIHPLTKENPGLHYAGARMHYVGGGMKFGGGAAYLSIYDTPFVGPNQFSAGLIKVSNGSDHVKAGWVVHPPLYGDNRARLFTYLHTRDEQCFNAMCPGFVLINSDIPLGWPFPKVSVTGVEVVEEKFYIFRDKVNGNWWLNLGDNNTDIGFWPSRLFTDMAYPADDVFWGGEIFSAPNTKSSPMGNGVKIKNEEPTLYAYCRRVAVVDDDKQIVQPVMMTDPVTDISWDYVRQKWLTFKSFWRRTILFGGPGDVWGE